MAMVGINGEPCPKCGQCITTEKQVFTVFPERKVYIECHNSDCRQETYFGTYTMIGNTLAKVS